jgi:hypothetical protein
VYNRAVDQATRVVVLVGVILLGARGWLGCQSSAQAPIAGTAGAPPSGGAGAPGGAGAISGSAASGGGSGATGATDGSAASGGASGAAGTSDASAGADGGAGQPCAVAAGGFAGGFTGPPCGPTTCDGDTVVQTPYCDQATCTGPLSAPTRTPCGSGFACVGGTCLTRAAAPTMACSTPTDCTLPASTCVVSSSLSELMIFSDPTCDEGQCHWKQIIDTCASSDEAGFFRCADGQCYDPGMLTRGPIPTMLTPDSIQPPAPPAQACAKASDCLSPSPTCYRDSAVTYVNPACHGGACSWEATITECSGACGDGGTCSGS